MGGRKKIILNAESGVIVSGDTGLNAKNINVDQTIRAKEVSAENIKEMELRIIQLENEIASLHS